MWVTYATYSSILILLTNANSYLRFQKPKKKTKAKKRNKQTNKQKTYCIAQKN